MCNNYITMCCLTIPGAYRGQNILNSKHPIVMEWWVLLPVMFLICFVKNWSNPGLFLFIFIISTWHNSKKRGWCAWDSNPGQQDGRCRQIHWAMAAALICLVCTAPRGSLGPSLRLQSSWSMKFWALLGDYNQHLDVNRLGTWLLPSGKILRKLLVTLLVLC